MYSLRTEIEFPVSVINKQKVDIGAEIQLNTSAFSESYDGECASNFSRQAPVEILDADSHHSIND